MTSTNPARDPGGPITYNDPRYYPIARWQEVSGDFGDYITRRYNPEFPFGLGAFGNATNITATFNRSGKVVDLGRGTFGLATLEGDPSVLPAGTPLYEREWIMDTSGGPGFSFRWERASSAYDLSLESMLAELDQVAGGYAYFYATQADIGGVFSPVQDIAQIRLAEGKPTVDLGGTKPTPPVAAVPLPAPFVMLGMAMLGLAGLGRRTRVS